MVKVVAWQEARRRGPFLGVAPDLACQPLSLVNVCYFGLPEAGDRRWVLIDAGLSFSATRITKAAAMRFGRRSRPAAIILTHGHFDHVGALPELADQWAAPIFAHRLEMPYLTGESRYPPPDSAVGGGAMSLLARLYPSGPKNLGNRVRELPADGSIPGMPGWRWIHTPGHTAGHVSLFRDTDRTLIAGDAFVTLRQESLLAVMTQPTEVRRPPAYFTSDWEAARRSVAALAALRPHAVIAGHGMPMFGESLRRGLDELVRNWQEVAVPAHGRYVDRPAITDEHGVVSVPPPVTDPQLLALAGLGLAAAAGLLFLRRSGRQA